MSPQSRLVVVLLAAAGAAAGGFPRSATQSALVVQKQGTSEYHRPWCAVVRDGEGVVALTLAQAGARGLKSHAACEKDPSAADAEQTRGTGGGTARKPAAPVFVHIDAKYYHREKCARSVAPLKRVPLDVAGKTRWPCPACRPPLRKNMG